MIGIAELVDDRPQGYRYTLGPGAILVPLRCGKPDYWWRDPCVGGHSYIYRFFETPLMFDVVFFLPSPHAAQGF